MNQIPLILSVETATLGGSVCVARGAEALAARLGDPQTSHSNSLLEDINNSLLEAGITLERITHFAAASGPGSFTGLRIGLATVKALAATLGRPCVGIPTLQAVAHAVGPSKATVALLPAGRGEVFAQLLSVSVEGVVTEADKAAHLSPLRLLDKYGSRRNLRWAGEGAHIHRELIRTYAKEAQIPFNGPENESTIEGWVLAPAETNLARHIALLALHELERGDSFVPQSLRAIYVRPSDAELKEQCR